MPDIDARVATELCPHGLVCCTIALGRHRPPYTGDIRDAPAGVSRYGPTAHVKVAADIAVERAERCIARAVWWRRTPLGREVCRQGRARREDPV